MDENTVEQLEVIHRGSEDGQASTGVIYRRRTIHTLVMHLSEVCRHPFVIALTGFLLTGILGTYLTWSLNLSSHMQDIEMSTRSSATDAVIDLSNLANERRERGMLVASAIRRNAPQAETDERKQAYDEAYVRWNTKVPGDLLRIRAGLQRSYRPSYERYIDGLTSMSVLLYGTNADLILHGQNLPRRNGLFSITDACLTQAFDAYRQNAYHLSPQISMTLSGCRFNEIYTQSISCFSMIAESLYSAVNSLNHVPSVPISDEQVVDECKPAGPMPASAGPAQPGSRNVVP